mmetsp:Transcript_9166/g.11439  ORF Transcript_9166/g.11439 Transcript_9166/m.11439 type:complete len:360 (-) Transcript_9166:580-1659(-)|eukprot:CAMPEP_0204839284 /NCGR_PEP_ID=MMETSP1346-20131115/33579_1 /ASSEMBLY_ACC=CAM_ASM_000771 /TAXON_ID=215587 /ORGANISM="Aplanochytrium stocchinoi, Strain GSBS06" /LENGTH=359 /DNA_ID=CAMNT_0051975879 /DNA_START=43 /DNA_END=1122 /DNA_ORIENTATION=+
MAFENRYSCLVSGIIGFVVGSLYTISFIARNRRLIDEVSRRVIQEELIIEQEKRTEARVSKIEKVIVEGANNVEPERNPSVDRDGVNVEKRILRRAETVLKHRIDNVVIVLERISDSHNYTAIMRTCEALGYQNVYVVSVKDSVKSMGDERRRSSNLAREKQWSSENEDHKMHVAFGRGAYKWLTVREYDSVTTCIEELKKEDFEIWCTDLSQKAVSFDYTKRNLIKIPKRLAVVIGTESTGVSQAFIDASSKRIFLPMNGFADSLNVSVAAAIVMQQLIWMKPELIGSLEDAKKKTLRIKWYEKLARSPEELSEYQRHSNVPPEPFRDTRRADKHRSGWTKKKDKKKEVNAQEYVPGR